MLVSTKREAALQPHLEPKPEFYFSEEKISLRVNLGVRLISAVKAHGCPPPPMTLQPF